MSDPLSASPPSATTPGTIGRIITPSATDLNPTAKSIVTLTAGNVTLVPAGNAPAVTLAFVGLPAGWVCPFRVRRVTAATATVATIEG